jgi:uroporphyrinogen decarboxylase
MPLIGFCGAPWTLFSYVMEGGGSTTLQKAITWIFKHPTESHTLLVRIADVCVDFLAQPGPNSFSPPMFTQAAPKLV